MSTNNEPQVSGENVRNPEVHYERRDLSARVVFGFFIALAIAGVIMHIALWGVFKYLGRQEYRGHPTQPNPIETSSEQIPGGDPAVTFPAPRLQPDPVADLNKFRAAEENILNSYGWVDQKAGTVHIPIEKAIDIVAQQGLPVRPPPGLPAGRQGARMEPAPVPGATGGRTGTASKQ
jgi:hypothetical protein